MGWGKQNTKKDVITNHKVYLKNVLPLSFPVITGSTSPSVKSVAVKLSAACFSIVSMSLKQALMNKLALFGFKRLLKSETH